MEQLITKIIDDFHPRNVLEIYVMDENGKPMEIFSGPIEELQASMLEEVFVMQGCFYIMSIVGVNEKLVISDRLSRNDMARKEFCWLTQPNPPKVMKAGSKFISLEWDPVRFCGVNRLLINKDVNYILEVSEGRNWKPGFVLGFAEGTETEDYRLMCRGTEMTKVVIHDLKPAKWYHWRIGIEYMGRIVYSEAIAIHTNKSIPEPPSKPRVQFRQSKNPIDPKIPSMRDHQIRLVWPAPHDNGGSIEKYQLQVKEELEIDFVGPDTFARAESPTSHAHASPQANADEDHKFAMIGMIPSSPPAVKLEKWCVVYCKQYPEAVIPAPGRGVLEWKFRVRAQSSEGWSPWSPILSVNRWSHPKIFRYPLEGQNNNRKTSNQNMNFDSNMNLTLDTIGSDYDGPENNGSQQHQTSNVINVDNGVNDDSLVDVHGNIHISNEGDSNTNNNYNNTDSIGNAEVVVETEDGYSIEGMSINSASIDNKNNINNSDNNNNIVIPEMKLIGVKTLPEEYDVGFTEDFSRALNTTALIPPLKKKYFIDDYVQREVSLLGLAIPINRDMMAAVVNEPLRYSAIAEGASLR